MRIIRTFPYLLKSVDCFQNREVTLQYIGPDFLNLTTQEIQTKCLKKSLLLATLALNNLGKILCREFNDLYTGSFFKSSFQCQDKVLIIDAICQLDFVLFSLKSLCC